MRVMGLDLGAKRIGVALSDESHTLATPYAILRRISFSHLLTQLEKIVHEQAVEAMVVGFPRSLDGHIGPQARHLTDEAERIKEHLGLPMTLWDEALTTRRAEQLLAEHSARPGRRRDRRQLDAVAAAVILQEFLDSHSPAPTIPEIEE
jgi:putative Holliday junction resolvase